MSQEKVAKYKEEKAKRKAIMRKQRIERIVRNSLSVLVLVLLVGWIIGSGVKYYQDNKPREVVEVDYDSLNEYVNGLNQE